MIKRATIYFNDNIIESITGEWLSIYNELFSNQYQKKAYDYMNGNNNNIYIPLPFWFTKKKSYALPHIKISNTTAIKLELEFNNLDELISNKITNNEEEFNLNIYTSYIFVDNRELIRNNKFQYNIELIQENRFNIPDYNDNYNADLKFDNMSKGIIWYHRLKHNDDYNNSTSYDTFRSAQLKLNNVERFSNNSSYFRIMQNYSNYNCIPKLNIYSYSFCKDDNYLLNINKFDSVNLLINYNNDQLYKDLELVVYNRAVRTLIFENNTATLI